MAYEIGKVGPEGEIVISKEMREKLGIESGWRVYQFLRDDHMKIYFLPLADDKSLAGSLAEYVTEDNKITDENWQEVRDRAWTRAIEENW